MPGRYLFLTFPVAVWLIDGSAAGRFGGIFAAAIAGWFFGFGYFFAGLYWIGHAFLVDAKTFGWLLPIAVTALARRARDLHRLPASRWRARSGDAGPRASLLSPPRSRSSNGCAAMCCPAFPGTVTAMR